MVLFRLVFLFVTILGSSSSLSTASLKEGCSYFLGDNSRRTFMFGLVSVPATMCGFSSKVTAAEVSLQFQLNVKVTLPTNIDKNLLLGPDTALFITARPVIVSEDQIPPELVMKYAKVPPVLTKKVDFPKDFIVTLGMEDTTPEGQQWNGWETLPLTVSARLDTDGLASTRNSTDLVGRISPVAPGTLGIVPLQGRGIVGKLLK